MDINLSREVGRAASEDEGHEDAFSILSTDDVEAKTCTSNSERNLLTKAFRNSLKGPRGISSL